MLPSGSEQVGELQLRGHNVTKGYLGDPEATADALRDGWLRTGDLVYRDDEGFFFVVDRIKDLIIRGGYNVYPREVEEVLYAHPDVSEAAVIGRPDPRLGEEIVAVVTARPGRSIDEADVIAFCKARLPRTSNRARSGSSTRFPRTPPESSSSASSGCGASPRADSRIPELHDVISSAWTSG